MAAAASCRCSSVVFVGNIPYHANEDELRAASEEIDPVVSLRVATDKGSTSSRPRGFAFVEYLDDETTLSACRNLHGQALRSRDLRVGLAQRPPPADEPVGVKGATQAASLLAPGARPRSAVTSYLAGLSRRHLRELLDALEREDAALMEHAKQEFAGLSTLIEQARVPAAVRSATAAAVEGDGGSGSASPHRAVTAAPRRVLTTMLHPRPASSRRRRSAGHAPPSRDAKLRLRAHAKLRQRFASSKEKTHFCVPRRLLPKMRCWFGSAIGARSW